jgi:hypothetical protein
MILPSFFGVRKMRTTIVSLFLLVLVFYCQACFFDKSHDTCDALKAYHARKNQLLTVFANKSVFKRGNGIIFEIDKGQLRNSFYLRKKTTTDSSLEFLNDSLEFQPAFDIDFLKSSGLDENNIKKAAEAYASHLLTQMDSLEISDFRSDFSRFGIDLEFYFKDRSRLIYVSSLERIFNPEWRAFINKANKIDQNWYHCPPD